MVDQKNSLIIVTGENKAIFYLIKNGNVEQMSQVEISKRSYSDREGFFLRSGGGDTYGSGEPLRDLKRHFREKLLQKLQKEARRVFALVEPQKVYLFAPKHLLGPVLESLGNEYAEKIELKIAMDMLKQNPVAIIKIIDEKLNEKYGAKVPRKEEARKIIKKADLANKFV